MRTQLYIVAAFLLSHAVVGTGAVGNRLPDRQQFYQVALGQISEISQDGERSEFASKSPHASL
jgi:hypothetical protein